ncbi:hypothetical protein [Domibacillus antri]|uniref:hypothetical protein n=1 Tax=Domibacillus antri TaxID=1714264 RepID=UPI000AFF7013|nr:hypothetical protein [Domibacillus antri]
MKKLGWMLSGLGALSILGSVLYPLQMISKDTFFIMLLGGAGVMFIGSMIRSFAVLKK